MFSANKVVALVAALAAPALAHYNFEALIVNNNITGAYEFVRQTTNSNSPITDVNSTDMICNQGGLDADIMAKTSTYSVSPGDEVGFTVNVNIGHPGPLSVWLSKAPDGTTAQEYDGSGDWFKVYELTTSSITSEGLQWATYVGGGIHNFTFALPDSLPAGEYLMRAEHIALHGAGTYGGAQFYMGCAQLSVGGSGTGSPSPTASIPGVYTGNEPGILINIYWPVPTNYTAPGPETWPNACEDHTANFADQTSDGDCTGSDGSSSGGTTGTTTAAVASSTAAATQTTSAAADTTTSAAAEITTSAAETTTSATEETTSTTAAAVDTTSAAAEADSSSTSTTAAAVETATSTSSAATATKTSTCKRRRKARRNQL